jgi:hypothetical protein
MIKAEIKQIDQSVAALRKFGLSVGSVLSIAGGIMYLADWQGFIWFLLSGILLVLAGYVSPRILKPINLVWMGIAVILGFIMTRVILSLLYYFVLTPIGFIARISGKRFLTTNFDKGAGTYWEKRGEEAFKQIDYEMQF